MRYLFIMMCIAVFITGCGDDENKSRSKSTSAMTTTSPADSSSDQSSIPLGPGVSKMINGISIVDHSRDEKEFELRRSIGGIESMIKGYKEQGLDTAELEKQLAELRKQLMNLIS